jgi:hypothetical protein
MSNRLVIRAAFAFALSLMAFVWHSAAQEKTEVSRQAVNAKARRDLAKEIYETKLEVYMTAPVTGPQDVDVEYYRDWSVRWMQAERDMSQKKLDHITALEDHLRRMQFWKGRLSQRAGAGGPNLFFAERAAAFFYLEAKEWLAEANDPAQP